MHGCSRAVNYSYRLLSLNYLPLKNPQSLLVVFVRCFSVVFFLCVLCINIEPLGSNSHSNSLVLNVSNRGVSLYTRTSLQLSNDVTHCWPSCRFLFHALSNQCHHGWLLHSLEKSFMLFWIGEPSAAHLQQENTIAIDIHFW